MYTPFALSNVDSAAHIEEVPHRLKQNVNSLNAALYYNF